MTHFFLQCVLLLFHSHPFPTCSSFFFFSFIRLCWTGTCSDQMYEASIPALVPAWLHICLGHKGWPHPPISHFRQASLWSILIKARKSSATSPPSLWSTMRIKLQRGRFLCEGEAAKSVQAALTSEYGMGENREDWRVRRTGFQILHHSRPFPFLPHLEITEEHSVGLTLSILLGHLWEQTRFWSELALQTFKK